MTMIVGTGDTTSALARAETTSPLAAVAPRNLDDVFRLAEVAAKSGLYGVRSREDAFIRMATGMELGLSAIQSLRGIWVLNGRPSLGAELMVALCLRHPECERFELVASSLQAATWRTVRRGHETKLTWTMDQAQKAGLAGGTVWKAYGETMLRWRCASALAKLVYPEMMMGLLSTEEASSINERKAPVEMVGGELVLSPAAAPVAESDGAPVRVDLTSQVTYAPPDYAADIQAATTQEQLAKVGEAIAAARSRGQVTAEDTHVLQPVYAAKKRQLAAEVER